MRVESRNNDDVLELAFLTISHVSKSHDTKQSVHICRWCGGRARTGLSSYYHKKKCPHHIAVSLLVKAIEARRRSPAVEQVLSFANSMYAWERDCVQCILSKITSGGLRRWDSRT